MHWIDPDQLPEIAGTVERFIANAHGEPDGMILADGTEVHVPPHLGAELLAALRPGDPVRIRGLRPRGVAMLAAVAVTPAQGPAIVDHGPQRDAPKTRDAPKPPKPPATEAEMAGTLRLVLHGPKGEPRGVLLEDGRSGRFPPAAAAAIGHLLQPGAPLFARGEARDTPCGPVIAIRELGATSGDARKLEPKHKAPHAA